MKKSIKLIAILLFVSICTVVMPGVQAKTINSIPPAKIVINISSLPSNVGVGVNIEKNTAGKAVIMIFDEYGNVLLKQVLPTGKGVEKDYILNKLDNGEYTIHVTSNKKEMEKDIRVFDGQCTFR
jgi:hypothetical protein